MHHDSERVAMEKIFTIVAGEDGEIDWMELAELLKRAMRDGM